MDILYITKKDGFSCDELELRWSLRSIAKYGKGISRVFVVGYCPDWLSDEVIKIPYASSVDASDEKKKNWDIADKVLYAVEHSDIGEEFLVSMDDHFYIAETDFSDYPFFVKNVNGGYLPTEPTDFAYHEFLRECGVFLKEKGLPTLYFTLHRNMHVSRSSIIACSEILREAKTNNRAVELFVLLNNYRYACGEITPVIVDDLKIQKGTEYWKIAGKDVFSTNELLPCKGLAVLLANLFPMQCKYEKEVLPTIEKESASDMRVALVCMCRREENYIDEWLDYHLELGFDNIFILDNNDVGDDKMKDILRSRRDDRIRYVDIRGKKHYQTSAYTKLYFDERQNYDWIAYWDADEFIEFADKSMNIKSFLASNPRFALAHEVRLCWKLFSDNDLLDVFDANYSIKRFTKPIEKEASYEKRRQCKSIINTKYKGMVSVHGIYRDWILAVNSVGKKCRNNSIYIGDEPFFGAAWINHYRTKTIGEFVRQKMFRGNAESSSREKRYDTLLEFWRDNEYTKEKDDYAKQLMRELYKITN